LTSQIFSSIPISNLNKIQWQKLFIFLNPMGRYFFQFLELWKVLFGPNQVGAV
jgi:hypothetical protein